MDRGGSDVLLGTVVFPTPKSRLELLFKNYD